MADFIWSIENGIPVSRFDRLYNNMVEPSDKLLIFGSGETYTHIEKGEDFVTILGYCYYPEESIQKTGVRILDTFNESAISDLKSQLIGQFIIIIKKDQRIYIFADWLHIRNIYYSKKLKFISSSFSIIEDILQTNLNDLDLDKVVEFLAMKHIEYPSWLGANTMHQKIKRLRPFEYIMIDTSSFDAQIGSIEFFIDNTKENDIDKISAKLTANLRRIIENSNLKEKKIGITLTGGYDSRLIALIASMYYKNSKFRLATAKEALGSIKDSNIAKKIAKSIKIPLKIYPITIESERSRFNFFTEGITPLENAVITPVIENSNDYDLGFGGCFGTELFKLFTYTSVDEYIEKSINSAKKNIKVNERTWDQLHNSIREEFNNIQKHYRLSNPNPNDEIRIFLLLNTAAFSAPMLSAYNIKGFHNEPYGHMSILEIALQVSDEFMEKKGRFHSPIVQKVAMGKLDYKIGKIMTTHTHYEPMVPYSPRSFPSYLFNYIKYKIIGLTERTNRKYDQKINIRIKDVCYSTDGWDSLFLRRIQDKYGINVKKQVIS